MSHSLELIGLPSASAAGASRDKIITITASARPASLQRDPTRSETLRHAEHFDVREQRHASKGSAIAIIVQQTVVTMMSSVVTGFITLGIPQISKDLDIPQSLVYWPVLVYTLTSGACLLIAGSMADMVGSRMMNLIGCFLLGIFIHGCGLAQTSIQLIMFRAFQGIAAALFLPTSMSLITQSVPEGKLRNVGLSCLGMGQVIGFAFGLVIAGALVVSIGWRVGFYIAGALTLVVFGVGVHVLPKDKPGEQRIMQRLKDEVDWVGGGIASICLGLLAFVLAMITASTSNIHKPHIITLLTIGLLLIPAFIMWVGRQERLNKAALIPNSLWRNKSFTTACIMVVFSFAVMQTMELLSSLFFQQIQHLSALQSSIRFLPSLVLGAALEVTTGFFINRLPAYWLVLITTGLNAGSPLLMALIKPSWPYWYNAFPAQLLQPVSVDVLFTVSLLIISSSFPPSTQALAGAVFSTIGQFGQALGLGLIAVISSSVTTDHEGAGEEHDSTAALLAGYRAGFWTSFAWMVLATVVGAVGFRGVGRVGVKRD